MRDVHTPAAIRSTLQYIVASDLPAGHKATVIEALTDALRKQQSDDTRRLLDDEAGGQWQSHELTELDSHLEGQVAKSWQHADEIVMRIAGQLHRRRDDVREKAIERGFGTSVNFALAKAKAAAATHEQD